MAGGLIEDLCCGHHVSAGHYCAGVVELHLRRAPGSPGLEPQQHKPGVGGPGRSLINKQTLELHYLVLQRGISARAWKAISNTLAFPPGMEAYK